MSNTSMREDPTTAVPAEVERLVEPSRQSPAKRVARRPAPLA